MEKIDLNEGVEFGIALVLCLLLGIIIAAIHTVMVIKFEMPAMIATLSAQLMLFIIRKTTYGRNIFAVGGNKEAARLSGINVVKTKFIMA